MEIKSKISRDGQKCFYYLETGRDAGERIALNIFTYVNPKVPRERLHNDAATAQLEARAKEKAQTKQTHADPAFFEPLSHDFLSFYEAHVELFYRKDNRHLTCSFSRFKKFIGDKLQLSATDVTPAFCQNFRDYLLGDLAGQTPQHYFAAFKEVTHAAFKAGILKDDPASAIAAKTGKRSSYEKLRLSAADLVALFQATCMDKEVASAFVFCCFTGLQWFQVLELCWQHVKFSSMTVRNFYRHSDGRPMLLQPAVRQLIKYLRFKRTTILPSDRIFTLPDADIANGILKRWADNAGLKIEITWQVAHRSFPMLAGNPKLQKLLIAYYQAAVITIPHTSQLPHIA